MSVASVHVMSPAAPVAESAELTVARAAALEVGALLRAHFAAGVATEWKGRGDTVTVADREAEAIVRRHLAAAFGDDVVVGEEGAFVPEADVRGRRRWYVDPLDGTTNFIKGQPRWATSIGFVGADDRTAAAVVHLPLTGATFAAGLGRGATLDGAPLLAPTDVPAAEGLALLGPLDGVAEAVPAVGGATLSVRVTGSTVTDLADVACGRADLYLGTRQGRWDLAAGLLLVTEAGGVATDLDGAPLDGPREEPVVAVAGGARVHATVLPLVRAAVTA